MSFDVLLKSGWLIRTFILVENSSYYYSHLIIYPDKKNEFRVGPFSINLLSCLGLYPSGWVFLDYEDVQKSADMISSLCGYFIEESNQLLDGLNFISSP